VALVSRIRGWRAAAQMQRVAAAFVALQYAGKVPSQWLRHTIYCRLYGMTLGDGSVVYNGCQLREPHKIRIGKNSSIGDQCILDGRAGLTIGDCVNFSTGVWIWTMQHDPSDPGFRGEGAPVAVEDFAWLSCRVVVLPGVTIGKGAVVAAGAVVTKSVEPFTIVGGVPARKIGERPQNLDYKLGAWLPFF
jgi:acetyltransferase-like isoleucine patch superfamily enzyme